MNKKIYLSLIPVVIIAAATIIYFDNFSKTATTTKEESNVTEEQAQESVENVTVTEPETTVESTPQTSQSTTNNNTDSIQTDEVQKTLAVSPSRCRGCGRCVAIDSAHFEMSGRIATVVTQTNLDSSALARAIDSCPAGAITLN
jgi:ferredoxin